VKFNVKNGYIYITLSLSVERDDSYFNKEKNYLITTIRDTGKGIEDY